MSLSSRLVGLRRLPRAVLLGDLSLAAGYELLRFILTSVSNLRRLRATRLGFETFR